MRILQRVPTLGRCRRRDVLTYATQRQRRQLLQLAERLRGRRIVHVSATRVGGGVAEIMKSLVPYLRALGVQCDWYTIDPRAVPAAFFAMTNRLHNALQGSPSAFRSTDWRRYARINRQIAQDLRRTDYDLVVLHDPQPLGSIRFLPADRPRVSIIHIDTSHAHPPVWRKLLPFIARSDGVVFSHRQFVHASLPGRLVRIFTPAIDPFALKQRMVPPRRARRYLARYRIPITGPLIVQVSRFDAWKNPLGVIAAHTLVRQALPSVQTMLVGLNEATDNPQAATIYRDIVRVAEEHQSVHVFFHPWGIRSIPEFTMMAQNAADIVVQNSTREGFGLTVTEAMWKGKPVIGGPASGIRRQIRHGRNGLIAENSEALATTILTLLHRPDRRRRLGAAATASVRKQFLMHRLVLDHLRLYASVERQ